MRAKITKRQVDSIQPEAKDIFLWDTDIRGFGLKVTPTGTKTYLFQYRMGGRGHPTRRYTIGPHGPLTPDEARNNKYVLSDSTPRRHDRFNRRSQRGDD